MSDDSKLLTILETVTSKIKKFNGITNVSNKRAIILRNGCISFIRPTGFMSHIPAKYKKALEMALRIPFANYGIELSSDCKTICAIVKGKVEIATCYLSIMTNIVYVSGLMYFYDDEPVSITVLNGNVSAVSRRGLELLPSNVEQTINLPLDNIRIIRIKDVGIDSNFIPWLMHSGHRVGYDEYKQNIYCNFDSKYVGIKMVETFSFAMIKEDGSEDVFIKFCNLGDNCLYGQLFCITNNKIYTCVDNTPRNLYGSITRLYTGEFRHGQPTEIIRKDNGEKLYIRDPSLNISLIPQPDGTSKIIEYDYSSSNRI